MASMRKQQQLGLVAEGSSANSAVLNLPKLGESIGPIKSGSLRLARRLSNMLGAGYAVTEYKQLEAAQMILIRVPDLRLQRILEELCSSELPLKNLSFILCETWLPSDAMDCLSRKGASVATVVGFPRIRPDWFIMEGELSAVQRIRRVLEQNEARVAEVRTGCKHLYFAAELLATVSPIFSLIGAQHALREGGLTGNKLSSLLSDMTGKLVRDFKQGARTSCSDPLAGCPAQVAKDYLEKLRADHPEITALLERLLPTPAGSAYRITVGPDRPRLPNS